MSRGQAPTSACSGARPCSGSRIGGTGPHSRLTHPGQGAGKPKSAAGARSNYPAQRVAGEGVTSNVEQTAERELPSRAQPLQRKVAESPTGCRATTSTNQGRGSRGSPCGTERGTARTMGSSVGPRWAGSGAIAPVRRRGPTRSVPAPPSASCDAAPCKGARPPGTGAWPGAAVAGHRPPVRRGSRTGHRCTKRPAIVAHERRGGPTSPNTSTPRARVRVHAGRLDATRRAGVPGAGTDQLQDRREGRMINQPGEHPPSIGSAVQFTHKGKTIHDHHAARQRTR